MKLYRQSHTQDRGSLVLFDRTPDISWQSKTKQIRLSVTDVPHDNPTNTTRYDYWVDLTIEDLQQMIGSLAQI